MSGSEFFIDGMSGDNGTAVIFDCHFFNETMVCFYAPILYEGKIIGVLRGAYLAEEYLQSMISTTYFGEKADVFLCTPGGKVIANSNGIGYEGNLLDGLLESGVIDEDTAVAAKEVFEHGGAGAFICDSESKTDNICVMYLPDDHYVLVQAEYDKRRKHSRNSAGSSLDWLVCSLRRYAAYPCRKGKKAVRAGK